MAENARRTQQPTRRLLVSKTYTGLSACPIQQRRDDAINSGLFVQCFLEAASKSPDFNKNDMEELGSSKPEVREAASIRMRRRLFENLKIEMCKGDLH